MNGKYGRGLETMGASWFVSYAYYDYVDRTHLAWRKLTPILVVLPFIIMQRIRERIG